MDPALDPATGTYTGQMTRTLSNAVYLRLRTPLGSYWADTTLGSKLYTLAREKDVPRVAVLTRQYAEQALQPLVDDARAQSVTVTTERPGTGWLWLYIDVTDASGQVQSFKHPVKVG
ncbi:phage GP46 family protein [Paludibacterium yongneupense]|uniref:phage GP46 family protein n=1 Tax=Paludibacterium yongneupense TaxID=400061 RepID=UPI0003F4E3C8|nr:phage GP46 family protein [Paludibacterium yongneupense]